MAANNYQNRAQFDNVIAKIKWFSFLTHCVELTSLIYWYQFY